MYIESKKYLQKLLIISGSLLIFIALIVITIDPFFAYHAPILGLKPVQTKQEYQVNGALEHLSYDSILVGSSVTTNINNNELDSFYGCNTIKATGNCASPSLLCQYILKAYKYQSLENVFWGFDVFSLYSPLDIETTENQVIYLRNENLIDDVNYLWNIDVLFKDSLYMITTSYLHEYDDGTAYNFAQYTSFGVSETLTSYYPSGEISAMLPPDYNFDIVEENVQCIKSIVLNHPETTFRFFLPAYSILWWDRAYREGQTEAYIYAMDYSISELLECENVEFYAGVFNEPDVLLNLNNYCDLTHASFEINQLTIETMMSGESQLTMENYKEELQAILDVLNEFEIRLEEEGTDWLYDY